MSTEVGECTCGEIWVGPEALAAALQHTAQGHPTTVYGAAV